MMKLFLLTIIAPCYGFKIQQSSNTRYPQYQTCKRICHSRDNLITSPNKLIPCDNHPLSFLNSRNRIDSHLRMSYLPPDNGNGNRGNDILSTFVEALPGIGFVAGIILFFLSPLGGIFFAVTNSLFLFALVAPVLLYTGFQIWIRINTIEGPCPSCNQPVFVPKDDEGQPSICFSCGATVRATRDKKSVELCSSNSINDDFFDVGINNSNSFMDMFSVRNEAEHTKTVENNRKKVARERTIIDVDVESDS